MGWNRFRASRRRRELDAELERDFAEWVDELTHRYRHDGLSPDAAHRRALIEMGGALQLKEAVRDERAGARLETALLDLRFAVRALGKARALTLLIVVTLAIGIGANTAIFSVVRATLLQSLPFRNADRLAFVWIARTQNQNPRGPMSGPDLRDLRTRSRAFADFAAIWSSGTVALAEGGEPEQVRAANVTINFFQVLGAEPALGRTFRSEDAARGADPTILIGWDLFERRFGGDASIVGRRIVVDDGPVTVIGVMPRGFRLLLPVEASVPDHLQAWVPFWSDLETGPRRNLFLRVIGRMRDGVSIGDARDDLARLGRESSREVGATRTFNMFELHDADVREIRAPLLTVFVAVGILLAIACVNVAGLLVARAASRTREIALRLALGASRGRLLRQSLAEGCVLVAVGAAAGLVAGSAALRALLTAAPESLTRVESSAMNVTVLAVTLAVAGACAVLFSLAPMTEVFAVEAASSLRPGRSLFRYAGGVGHRMRSALVVAQVALSVVLLVGAALLVRTFVNVLAVDTGFRSERQVTFRLAVPPRYESREAFSLFGEELRRQLAKVSGVTGVGAISHIPFDDLPNWSQWYGGERPLPSDAPLADARAVSAGAFEALGVRLVSGRFFTEADLDPSNPVVIVDELVAKQQWPNRSPVGERLFTRAGAQDLQMTVVGVVPHLRLRSLVDTLLPQIFVPWPAAPRNPIAFVVRTDRTAADIAGDLRSTVARVDPRVPIYDVRPLEEYVDSARALRRFAMLLAAAFAASAALVAGVGIYGVLSYAVANRRRELGVRRALGATAGDIMREIGREGVPLVAAGIAIGLAGAALSGRLLQSQLFGVDPHDAVAYGAAIALIAAGSLAASWIPARRAAVIDPVEVLKTE